MPKFEPMGQTQTSTQIRNLYSPDLSYLNIKFFNVKLSFRFVPFTGRDQNGRSQYDDKNGQQTTVDFEGAFALYTTAKNIIDGKITECDLTIPCPANSSLNLKRTMGQSGQMETVFTISKNNMLIPFKFNTITQTVNENGQTITKQIEVGLGAFMKTVEGYLTGINAERHLNKLTEEFAALQNQQGQQQGGGQPHGGQQNQWNGNNGQKRFNNNRRQNYNQYPNQQQNRWPQQNQQNMSNYTLPN